MTSRDDGGHALKRQLSLLGTALLLEDSGPTDGCLPQERLRDLALHPDRLDPTTRHHMSQCERCAYTYASFRGLAAVRALASSWRVTLDAKTLDPAVRNREWQFFGHLYLENGSVTWCDKSDWLYSPLCLRVTIIVDTTSDLVGVTIVDSPSEMRAATLHTPRCAVVLERDDTLGLFQAAESLVGVMGRSDLDAAGDAFIEAMRHGEVSLEFAIASEWGMVKTSGECGIAELLETEVVERTFDYQLPSGLHCDTYVNVGRLCRSEESLQRVAKAFDLLLDDCEFDTILTNGWAMATVARRIASIRRERREGRFVEEVICEGYQRLALAGDILPDSTVLVLVDVSVTGTLIGRLRELVERAGAVVAVVACLVEAESPRSKRLPSLRPLCRIPMDVVDPTTEHCRRCDKIEARVFNPMSQCMTQRAAHPRSPSEFLAENEEAREFWRLVDLAHAYEHHRKEEQTHYIAFVDTRKLLEHPEVGSPLITQLSARIRECVEPDVLLAPNRPRGKVLATMLAAALSSGGESLPVVAAHRHQRRGDRRLSSRPWFVRPADREYLQGRAVLVVDAAAGHGTTLDRLTQLAMEHNAKQVGAAVLVSRLPDACEQAFANRLSAGFTWLYHLPIRPVLIRGNDDSLCPICQRKAAIEQVARASGVDAIQQWLQHLGRPVRRSAPAAQPSRRGQQLQLFPMCNDFLEHCREAVASGVTLHALNAAMTNGMAPLTLPEIFNNHIPSRNRAAMVEHLPQGTVEWSGETLADDLREFLSRGTAANVWRASAEILVKEGADDWLLQVDELLVRLRCTKANTSSTFWNHFACTAYVAVTQNPQIRQAVRERLLHVARTTAGTSDAEGLQRVLEMVPE
ncbi:MAG: hypothetical protein KY475_01255 [Planctomycetes bacterium]|nr:hypothetical protein [Planctomycetota bacterium]